MKKRYLFLICASLFLSIVGCSPATKPLESAFNLEKITILQGQSPESVFAKLDLDLDKDAERTKEIGSQGVSIVKYSLKEPQQIYGLPQTMELRFAENDGASAFCDATFKTDGISKKDLFSYGKKLADMLDQKYGEPEYEKRSDYVRFNSYDTFEALEARDKTTLIVREIWHLPNDWDATIDYFMSDVTDEMGYQVVFQVYNIPEYTKNAKEDNSSL